MISPNDPLVKQALGGNPYALLNLKNALAGLSPEEAFAHYRELLGLPQRLRLEATRAGSMYAYSKAQAKTFIETAPSGVPFANRAPRVIGEGNHRDLVCSTRAFYVASVDNARLWGRSASIEVGNDILLDFEDWELARIDDQLEQDPRIFRSEGDSIWYIRDPAPDADLHVRRGFMLTGSHTGAFGHWIWEYLPKYVAALLGRDMPPLTVLIDEVMPAAHRQAVEAVLPAGSDILVVPPHKSVRAGELWYAPSLIYMPLLDKPNGKCLWDFHATPADRFIPVVRKIASDVCGNDSGQPHERRLYMARHAKWRRKLVNAQDIEAAVRARGFEIVNMENHTFAEQVQLARSARYIIGPEGSALFHAFFARPGTRFATLNHPDTLGQAVRTSLVDALGGQSVMVTGPFVNIYPERLHMSDYEIPLERFTQFLDDWLKD